MLLTNNTNGNYTMRQLKLPLEIEKLIDISDPVYTFCEVMDHIDLLSIPTPIEPPVRSLRATIPAA